MLAITVTKANFILNDYLFSFRQPNFLDLGTVEFKLEILLSINGLLSFVLFL